MPISGYFQGHWRALENKWLSVLKRIKLTDSTNTKIAVVVAGQPLTKQLLSKLDSNVLGVSFFPGIPKLAKALASTPSDNKVSISNSIALASLAGCSTENSKTSAKFFEKMLESGISADIFNIVLLSTKNIHHKVKETALLFAKYSEHRNKYYPLAPDNIMHDGPQNTNRFQLYIFYGFYDLNPLQRNYIEHLAKYSEILWFSPLYSAHKFSSPFHRTTKLLDKLSNHTATRIDLSSQLSPIAQFGHNLLTQKALVTTKSMELVLCGTGSAFSKTVTKLIKKKLSIYGTNEILVIATEADAKQIENQLFISNIPSATQFTISAAKLPFGIFLSELFDLPNNQFHHKDIEKLLLTGFIKIANTPDATAYFKKASLLGARFGLQALKETGYAFASVLSDFFTNLPQKTTPKKYLYATKALLNELSNKTMPSVFSDEVLTDNSFFPSNEIKIDVFIQMVQAALETKICFKKAETNGVTIYSPEKARGISEKVVIITGMEEGHFPRPTLNDPRLPVDVRKQLQLSSVDTKEIEDAFILRQLFETAEENLTFVCRNTDIKGKPLALSHFISSLNSEKNPIKITTLSDSPLNILNIPASPPFLNSSLNAQKARLSFNPENPGSNAKYNGMIGSGLYSLNSISATVLENYLRDPYNFMQERIWNIREEDEFPIRSEPPPLSRGKIVHQCVENALKTKIPIAKIVTKVCTQYNLHLLLGSNVLASLWKKHLINAIINLKQIITEKEWTLIETEKSLKGTIASFPANGKIDLIFKDKHDNYILADLKTGKPKDVKNTKSITLLKNNLLQLPFYRSLAMQNNYTPLSLSLYIHLQNNGDITFVQLTDSELESIHKEFEEIVKTTVHSINNGDFHESQKEKYERR